MDSRRGAKDTERRGKSPRHPGDEGGAAHTSINPPIISNTRIIISYKRGAQFRMRGKKGTADAEALVLLPADGVG
jgi:hypothetical protein